MGRDSVISLVSLTLVIGKQHISGLGRGMHGLSFQERVLYQA